ncbi:general negative regulator of transcription subunit 5 [Ceratocystis pirilliformis]|uniref:General negative regulator of transcription subunit n=1 Tax=Ceratocystis pirilliformis TaxID=259994 RepID=A0ABR3YQL8_9PEZI
MAARKLQQEVDKCFKKVAEGVAEFEAIYEKIEQSTNPAQKEKLEDNLKREIKKLQRMRDQIKTWAASNDIKDKTPLLDHRKLIETQMEKFKAVEKAMKTKAYSKEGLSAAAKLDPKEKAKEESGAFLREMVGSLELQVEALEVESESLSATIKRGKNNASKAERISEIEDIIERHKWHQGKLELIRRSLENGGIETEQVTDLEESIRYYVQDNSSPDFIEDEELYDDLHLDADEDNFGMNLADNDKGSSQDTQSIHDDGPTPGEAIIESLKAGSKNRSAETSNKRQVSAQLKSPLPTLATLHPPQPSSSASSTAIMKPASVPTRLAGEGLKYASAAAAAAANDKNNVGIAPLPPPPGSVPLKSSATSSPAVSVSHPVTEPTKSHSEASSKGINSAKSTPKTVASRLAKSVTSVSNSVSDAVEPSIATSSTASPPPAAVTGSLEKVPIQLLAPATTASASAPTSTQTPAVQSAQVTNGVSTKSSNKATGSTTASRVEEESIYHLPASLQDLLETYEATKARPMAANSPATQRLLEASHREAPKAMDSEMAKHYTPEIPMSSPSTNYPMQPLDILDNPRLYSRLETDTLFYLFYYRQGTMHQYMAARALKDQSWRFHKQYQTWFQRHEEPKNITEEYEQGTYRFFDYESTWMNRRKADFKFTYKFLEDDI